MITYKLKPERDGGWTFIEATLSIVIISIMVLGMTIVLMAFREHLNRSWAVRTMDQYGNDVVERLTHQLRNATDVTVRPGGRNTSRIDIEFLDPYVHDLFHTVSWRADTRTGRILVNNDAIDPTFPPPRLARGETFEIVKFTMSPYGSDTPNKWEHNDSFRRNEKFIDATWDIDFVLRYTRAAVNPGERNWTYEKEYTNRVYMRNKNLIVHKGITGS
jgi:hypothetical protein